MKEKKNIFCNVYFVQRIFFNDCVLSQYIVYWIKSQNVYTFTYQKTFLNTILLLVFKIVEYFKGILKWTGVTKRIIKNIDFNIDIAIENKVKPALDEKCWTRCLKDLSVFALKDINLRRLLSWKDKNTVISKKLEREKI